MERRTGKNTNPWNKPIDTTKKKTCEWKKCNFKFMLMFSKEKIIFLITITKLKGALDKTQEWYSGKFSKEKKLVYHEFKVKLLARY